MSTTPQLFGRVAQGRIIDSNIWKQAVIDLHQVMGVVRGVFLVIEHYNEPLARVGIEIVTCAETRRCLWWNDEWYSEDGKREWFRGVVREKLKRALQMATDGKMDMDEASASEAPSGELENMRKQFEGAESSLRAAEQQVKLLEMQCKDMETTVADAQFKNKSLEKTNEKLRTQLQQRDALLQEAQNKDPGVAEPITNLNYTGEANPAAAEVTRLGAHCKQLTEELKQSQQRVTDLEPKEQLLAGISTWFNRVFSRDLGPEAMSFNRQKVPGPGGGAYAVAPSAVPICAGTDWAEGSAGDCGSSSSTGPGNTTDMGGSAEAGIPGVHPRGHSQSVKSRRVLREGSGNLADQVHKELAIAERCIMELRKKAEETKVVHVPIVSSQSNDSDSQRLADNRAELAALRSELQESAKQLELERKQNSELRGASDEAYKQVERLRLDLAAAEADVVAAAARAASAQASAAQADTAAAAHAAAAKAAAQAAAAAEAAAAAAAAERARIDAEARQVVQVMHVQEPAPLKRDSPGRESPRRDTHVRTVHEATQTSEDTGTSGQEVKELQELLRVRDAELEKLGAKAANQASDVKRLKSENEDLEKNKFRMLHMLHQLREQLKRVTEVAEKRGCGKVIQDILGEAGVLDSLNSDEMDCFKRLYEDALRRIEKHKRLEQQRTAISRPAPLMLDYSTAPLQRPSLRSVAEGADDTVSHGDTTCGPHETQPARSGTSIGRPGARPGLGGTLRRIEPSGGGNTSTAWSQAGATADLMTVGTPLASRATAFDELATRTPSHDRTVDSGLVGGSPTLNALEDLRKEPQQQKTHEESWISSRSLVRVEARSPAHDAALRWRLTSAAHPSLSNLNSCGARQLSTQDVLRQPEEGMEACGDMQRSKGVPGEVRSRSYSKSRSSPVLAQSASEPSDLAQRAAECPTSTGRFSSHRVANRGSVARRVSSVSRLPRRQKDVVHSRFVKTQPLDSISPDSLVGWALTGSKPDCFVHDGGLARTTPL